MPYKVSNDSNQTVLLNVWASNHFKTVPFPPGSYIYGTTIGDTMFFRDPSDKSQFIKDIYAAGLTVKDGNGNAVTYDAYKQANP